MLLTRATFVKRVTLMYSRSRQAAVRGKLLADKLLEQPHVRHGRRERLVMPILHVLPQPEASAPRCARPTSTPARSSPRRRQPSRRSAFASGVPRSPRRARHADRGRASLLGVGGAKHDAVAAAVADGDVGRGRGGALARAGCGRAGARRRSIRCRVVVLVAASADVVTREPRLLRLLHVGERALHGIRIRAGVEHDPLRPDVRVGTHVPVGSHELGGYGAQQRRAPAFAAAYAAAAAAALAAAAETGSPGARSPTAPRRMCLDAGSMAASAERWSSAQYLVSSSSFLAAACVQLATSPDPPGTTEHDRFAGALVLSTCGRLLLLLGGRLLLLGGRYGRYSLRDELGW